MSLSRNDIAIEVLNPDLEVSPDRGVLCGKTGSGKSTYAKVLINMFWQDWVKSEKYPEARIYIMDTKPRWRAEHLVSRWSKKPQLTDDPNKMIKHSYLIRNDSEYRKAKHDGVSTFIFQDKDLSTDDLIQWQVKIMQDMFKTQKEDIPTLLYIDEGMDFFGPSGNSRYGDIIQRCFRAGREMGIATFIGIQRPKQINLQVLTESNYLSLFKLRFSSDVERLYEMGYPIGMTPPTEDKHFALWRDEELISKNATLHLEKKG